MVTRITKVLLKPEVMESLLEYARLNHPNESIVLLRGKIKEDRVYIEQLIFPPRATHGETSSSFDPYLLPFDASIIGTAHSHPSTEMVPSLEDLLNFYGKIALLIVYPYSSLSSIVAYDRDGRVTSCELF